MKFEVQIDSNVTCSVVVNKTAQQSKQISLRLTRPYIIEITCGSQIQWPQIQSFITQKKLWILKRIHFLETQHTLCMQALNPKTHFLFLGKAVPYFVIINTSVNTNGNKLSKGKLNNISFVNNALNIYTNQNLNSQQAQLALNAWALNQAKSILPSRLTALAQEINLHPTKITVKNQQKRWGSCSSKGNINLNWRLVKCPSSVIDAICLHELFHLTEMNHSTKFWNLVYKQIPNYKDLTKWLNLYHPLIYDTPIEAP